MSAVAKCARRAPRLRVVDGGEQIAENGSMAAKKGAKASGGRSGEESKDLVASARSTAPTSREEAERYAREYLAKDVEKTALMRSASLLNLVDGLDDIGTELDRRGFTEAADLLLTIGAHLSTHVTSEMAGKPLSETITRKDLAKGNAAATARQSKSNLAALNEYLATKGKAPLVKRRPMSARNDLFVRLVNTVVDCREHGVSDLEIAENTLQSIRNILLSVPAGRRVDLTNSSSSDRFSSSMTSPAPTG